MPGEDVTPSLHPDCSLMLQRLERAGVRPVSELSPQAARRLGMRLFDLERQEGEASLLRQLMRLKSATVEQLAAAMARSETELDALLDRLYLSGSVLRQERQPGVVTWSTRLSQQRRTLQDRDLLDRLADPSLPTPIALAASNRLTSQNLALGGCLRARLYRPPTSGAAPLPVVLFAHGGGWVIGSVDTHDSLCRSLCEQSGCAILSVDYRLAPEHPWPAAADDMEWALHWLATHGSDLGLDVNRLGLVGDSAGGNLILVTALAARAAGRCRPRVLVLACATLDPNLAFPSYREQAEAPFLSAADMRWYVSHYQPDTKHWRASPLLGNLRDLPPTLVITASHDPARDDGEVFADRLDGAGGRVTLQRYEGMFHDFILFSSAVAAGRQACSQMARMLRDQLQPDEGPSGPQAPVSPAAP